MKPIKVLLDTSPLANANSLRGVGMYTRFLTQALERLSAVEVRRSGIANDQDFEPDVVHYPYFDLFFNTLPLHQSKPTVVTVHDVIPLKFPEYYLPGFKGKIRFLKQKNALQRVSAVITDSEASKADIHSLLDIESDKIHRIYLAANPDLKPASKTQINKVRRKYHLPKHYILYVGDINYNKNLPQLIKAIRYLPTKIKLVCLGRNFKPQNIPEWQWIETQLALSNVAERVKFITDVTGEGSEELSVIYSAAKVYVQPSLYEGFGLPVLEAMQCQTPVVCSHNSSLLEVGGEQAIFVEPEATNIADGIKEVLSWSQTKRRKIVKQAFSWSQKFTWRKTAKQTLQVYKQIIS